MSKTLPANKQQKMLGITWQQEQMKSQKTGQTAGSKCQGTADYCDGANHYSKRNSGWMSEGTMSLVYNSKDDQDNTSLYRPITATSMIYKIAMQAINE